MLDSCGHPFFKSWSLTSWHHVFSLFPPRLIRLVWNRSRWFVTDLIQSGADDCTRFTEERNWVFPGLQSHFSSSIHLFAATAFSDQPVASSNLSKENQMPSYPELGRHTPPPPPYSSGQRNRSNTIARLESSRRSDPPPPPPPSLNSTQRKECMVPSTSELEQTAASGDPYSRRNSITTSAPPVNPQFPALQPLNPGQPVEYQARNQYCEFIRFGIPVEPQLVPGSRGHPLGPFDRLSMESKSEPVPHQSLVHDQSAERRRRPDINASATQSLGTSSLEQNVTSYATQTLPYGAAIDDRQPPPPFRNYPCTIIPSLGYPNGLDAPIPVESWGTVYPPTPLPSQQTIERRATLAAASTATAQPKSRHHASPARPTGRSNNPTMQGHDKWRRVSQANHRRPSVGVRFEPYKRRQSGAAGESTAGSRLGGEADKEPVKETRADSDVEMEERRGEGEGEGEHTH